MPRRFDVAVMHDFFVDRLVYTKSIRDVTRVISGKAREGGGGVHGVSQEEVCGGNAVNLARALSRLGLRTLLITHSDRAHEPMLREDFAGLPTELRVKSMPPGLTVALEERVNVMLGDSRGVSDFAPSVLDERDWDALRDSRVVCSMNWAANKHGTELLVALRRRLGKEKPIFLDPADFRDRTRTLGRLLEAISEKHVVDWVSMNEFEAATAARLLGIRATDLGRLCQGLARRLGVVFDLHCESKSYTSEGTRVASASVRRTKPRRLTGAGDVWDAGAIYGRIRRMDERTRLEFANRAARLYLESTEALPPTVEAVLREAR
jgi:sugar/nucleoside kinase (ribokinase family)